MLKIVSEKATFEVPTNQIILAVRGIPFRSKFQNWLFNRTQNEHFLPRNNGNRSESIPVPLILSFFLKDILGKRHNVGPSCDCLHPPRPVKVGRARPPPSDSGRPPLP
jgi:hypothetical protein